MLDNLSTITNRLFTAILLVALLFACQQMSEGKSTEQIQPKHQIN